MFVALTVVGYAGLVWVALAPALAIWARRPLASTTALTAACVWGSDLLTLTVKALVGRPRPFERLAEADPLVGATVGASFPSGHAATSFAGAIMLAYLVGRGIPALAALAVLISVSRVYVGVHYPLDVVGGAVLGAAVAAAAVLLLRSPRTSSRGRRRSAESRPAG